MMMQMPIAAISTPIGTGGISVIRLSGEGAVSVAESVYRGKHVLSEAPSHTIHLGYVLDENGAPIDQCLFSVMRAPHTYTGEDTVEISCHGGMLPTNRILSRLLSAGARLAEPGEFTKRAFLNGRMDLSQAEAVADVISAKTDPSLSLAVNQLGGTLSRKINELREELVGISAHVDATADFPEEEIDELANDALVNTLSHIRQELDTLIESADRGKILREGLKCAIVGKPNAGKSSLLNLLVGENRAIVTQIAGTTRDVIEEYVNLDGLPVRLADTAGIRDTEDEIEQLGVSRSKEWLEQADFCLLVEDASSPETEEDAVIRSLLSEKPYLVVRNKSDLPTAREPKEGEISFSAKTEQGLSELKQAIHRLFRLGDLTQSDGESLANLRQKEACIRAYEAVSEALTALSAGMEENLSYIYLEQAISALGEITGMSVSEEIIDRIFHRFCLGK